MFYKKSCTSGVIKGIHSPQNPNHEKHFVCVCNDSMLQK